MSTSESGAATRLHAAGYHVVGLNHPDYAFAESIPTEQRGKVPVRVNGDGTLAPYPDILPLDAAELAELDEPAWHLGVRHAGIIVRPASSYDLLMLLNELDLPIRRQAADGAYVFPVQDLSLRPTLIAVDEGSIEIVPAHHPHALPFRAPGDSWYGVDGEFPHPDDLPPLNNAAVDAIIARSEELEDLKVQVARAEVEDDGDGEGHVEFTDAQLAAMVDERTRGEIHHDATSPSGWWVWDGQRHRTTLRGHYAPIARTLEALAAEQLALQESAPTKEEKADAYKRAKQLGSVTAQNAVATMLHRKMQLGKEPTDFDTADFDLNTPAGIIDLWTGRVRPHDPSELHSKITAVAPAPQADEESCPRWLRFIEEVTRGDEDLARFMQKLAGYSATGSTAEHSVSFIYGPGGNGKSVFLETIAAALGDYATTAPLDTFTSTRSDKHPTDMASLEGARLVTASETQAGRTWDEQRLKALTGGDRVQARRMRQDFHEFTPRFTLLVAGNHEPHLERIDDAMRRRIHIVPFTFKPQNPDPELREKLEAEWPGILRWVLDGTALWLAEGLQPPEAVLQRTEEYFDAEDLPRQFVETACVIEPEGEMSRQDAYEAWRKFCGGVGASDPSTIGRLKDMKGRLAPLAEELGFEDTMIGAEHSRQRGWRGIRLGSQYRQMQGVV